MQSVKAVEQLTIEAVVSRSATWPGRPSPYILVDSVGVGHILVDSVGVGRDLLERYRQENPGVGQALDRV